MRKKGRIRNYSFSDSSGTLLYRPDGDNILLEQDGSANTITAYTYNPFGLVGNVISNRKSGTDSYYHYDAVGNVMDLTNSGESVVTTYNYDAFGNILAGSSANNKINFQTKPWEGTDIGLYYSRARYYDPQVGRFITKDPLGFVDGPNLYVYAGNNPVNWVDPEGLLGRCYSWKSVIVLDPCCASGLRYGTMYDCVKLYPSLKNPVKRYKVFDPGKCVPVGAPIPV